MRDCLLYFVRYPEPGRVKTRLARASSPERAAAFYAAMAEDLLARLAGGIGADVAVCFTPSSRGPEVRAWLGPERTFLAQRGKGLGERMANAFADAFSRGYDRVVLTGSDIPGLTPCIVSEAFGSLTPGRAVLGPARDGGYYLVGFHRDGFAPEVFEESAWGGAGVYARAVERLASAGKAVAALEPLADVDTVDDLRAMLASDGCPLSGRVRRLARAVADAGA